MSELAAALIVKALDGLTQRYLYTAQNIANANSPNYRPVRVSFEERLREASERGIDAVRAVSTEVTVPTSEGEPEPMRLDLEMAQASQTSMRYRALVEILSQQLALERAVTMGGER